MAVLQRSALLIAVLLPAGKAAAQADSLSARADAVAVQTDRAVYGPLDVVTVTFVNLRDSTVYLMPDGCRTPDGKALPLVRVERLEAGAWVRYAPGAVCGGIAPEPAPLRPDEPYSVRFQVGIFRPLPLGTYRYVFSVREDALRPETLLPEAAATSITFWLGV